jgi:6-phosphofructokinase 2
MSDIVTVTLNPALDISTSVDRVVDTRKLRCSPARRDPGGGGINVARVITRLGGRCAAVYLAGGSPGQALEQLLGGEGVTNLCLPIGSETRENFSVCETSTGREFRFVLPGPNVTQAEWQGCIDHVIGLDAPPRYLVISGSLPPSVPVTAYSSLARLAKANGIRVVVDTSGPALAATLQEGVFLVKPSLNELRELTGQPLASEAEWARSARDIVHEGRARMVALSLGERGAMLVTAERTLRAEALPVQVLSATGAGDSFLAGLVWALNRDADLEEAFRYAIAAGSAAVLSAGTGLCTRADVERLYDTLADTPIHCPSTLI